MATEDDLKASLSYDPRTGVITWLARTKFQGQEAGHSTKRGHRTINRKGIGYQTHRIAWLLYYGSWPSAGIDHIDGDPSNNRITNLREAGQEINNKNRKLNQNSSTGIAGVSWCKSANKWRAYINVNKRHLRIGHFESFNDAVAARKNAESQYGYHPNHGRP